MVNVFTIGIIFVSVSIIVSILAGISKTPNNIFERLSLRISNIIQILFLIGLFISYQTFVNTSKNNSMAQQAALTEKGWVQVYEKIQSNYDKAPNFCNSLTFDWQKPLNPNINIIQGKDDYGTVLSISILIFQALSNVLGYFLYADSGDSLNQWISSFIIWANSDILYEIWKKNKFIYDEPTRNFADLIFTKVRETPPNNNKEIVLLADKICKSKKLNDIFEVIGKVPPCKKNIEKIINNI